MKKGKVIIQILIWVVVVALAVVIFLGSKIKDSTGPVITAAAEVIYSASVDDETILSQFSAVDEKDGDVSDFMMIENVVSIDDETVNITVAAKDSSNNVSKYSVICTNYDVAAEEAEESLAADAEELSEADPEETAKADAEKETVEGPETEVPENTDESETETEAEAEPEPIDGELSYTKADNSGAVAAENPVILMKAADVVVKAGSSINWKAYVDTVLSVNEQTSEELMANVYITGYLDSDTPGNYQLEYHAYDNGHRDAEVVLLNIEVVE